MDLNKFKPKKEKETRRLETYMIAADDPVGRSQLRPFFKRKRSGEVLTREQVSAIKQGRKLLRKEMKEQGLKRRIDFEVTATNMGLYFDRNRLFWPFFLWLIRDNTVLKVLATTAVLTTAVTVSVPVIEYLTEYITEYIEKIVEEIVTQTVTEYEEKEVDRFTISLSDELFNSGFTLSENITFENASTQLVAMPAEGVPCISIRDIPRDVNDREGKYPSHAFLAYTFYCRYESTTEAPADYHWSLNITQESEVPMENPETGETFSRFTSDAIWVMIFEDNEMMLYAKTGADGEIEAIPEQGITDMGYNEPPMYEFAKDPQGQYEVVAEGQYFDLYRIKPQNFVSETLVAEGLMTGVAPFDINTFDPTAPYDPENPNGIHKYTIVIWLEGDDPECTNELIGSKIGMNFTINLLTEENEGEEGSGEGTGGEQGGEQGGETPGEGA